MSKDAIVLSEPPAVLAPAPPSALVILESAIRGGITAENVAVVKEIKEMVREERADQAKMAFNKAFFGLQKNLPEIYADKAAHDKSGGVTFVYCSEQELSRTLKPHLESWGFAMLCGQTCEDGRVTVSVTLIHEAGHSEVRSFTVRPGAPNAMKDAAMCDAGAATTAWRHLVTKMFGLKSRIRADSDARTEGELVTKEIAEELQRRVMETESNEIAFLKFCGVSVAGKPALEHYQQIRDSRYAEASELLARKEKRGR